MEKVDIIKFIDETIANITKFGISRDEYSKLTERFYELSKNPMLFTKFKSNNHVNEIVAILKDRRQVEVNKKAIDDVKVIESQIKAIDKYNTIADSIKPNSERVTLKPVYTLINYEKINILDIAFSDLVENYLELLTHDIKLQQELKEILNYTDDEKINFYSLNDLIDLYRFVSMANLDSYRDRLIEELGKSEINISVLPKEVREVLSEIEKPSFYPILKLIQKILNTIG